MKEWTKEEIEKLVPEEDLQRRAVALMPQVGRDTFSNWYLFEALLQTRLDLETVRELREFDKDKIDEMSKQMAFKSIEITRLRGALERSQSLIDQGIQYANGRDSEWGGASREMF